MLAKKSLSTALLISSSGKLYFLFDSILVCIWGVFLDSLSSLIFMQYLSLYHGTMFIIIRGDEVYGLCVDCYVYCLDIFLFIAEKYL